MAIFPCSFQFTCSVMSNSLQLHGLQHSGLPCPSPTPGVYSNPCPLNWWCHSTISGYTKLFFLNGYQFISVHFSRSFVSDSATPCTAPHQASLSITLTPEAFSNSCPLSWWCHPTISSSVSPFSSCLQSFPASGAFQMSQFFASGGQNIGASATVSVLPILPKNIQDWFPLG